jgi:hypothetical protein
MLSEETTNLRNESNLLINEFNLLIQKMTPQKFQLDV